MYKPSKQLWDILLNNGFKNVSYHFRNDYYNFYNGPADSYNPKLYRLAFAMGKGVSKFVIFFEYLDIEIVFAGRNQIIRDATLTENQLRSIIAFFKMPYNRRYKIAEITECRIELASELFEENKKHSLTYEFPLDKKFETAFRESKI